LAEYKNRLEESSEKNKELESIISRIQEHVSGWFPRRRRRRRRRSVMLVVALVVA